MNRHLVTVTDLAGSLSRCDAMWLTKEVTQVQASQLAGKPAPVAHAHGYGREIDDTNTSGEGPG